MIKKLTAVLFCVIITLCGCANSDLPAPETETGAPALQTTAPPETETADADTEFKPDPSVEYKRRLLAVYYDGKWSPGFTMTEDDVKRSDIVYYLSIYVQGDDSIELSNDRLTPEMIAEAKALNPGLKILACLVGDLRDGRNGGREFANAVSNDGKRADLCAALKKVMTEYGFDGADIDWEYPSDAVDRENEVKFAAALRETLDGMGEGYMLTAAIPSTAWGFDMHDVAGIAEYCDYLNIMTYDHHINDAETLHHTAPCNDGTGKYQTRGYSNEQTTQIFIERGVPAEKLILGCGLYCLEWRDVPAGDSHGFNMLGTRASNHTYHYRELEQLCKGSFKRYWDPTAKAAWYYSAENRIYLSCDDDESVRVKAELVNKYDNAGLMIFSYYTIRGRELLRSVRAWLDGDITYPASVDWSKYTGK